MLALTALALMLTTQDAVAAGATLPDLSLSGLPAFVASVLQGSPHWGGVPRQSGGTAAGRPNQVSAAATRAGRGVGHAPGKGPGELAAYAPYARHTTPGRTPALHGFNARTSKRIAAKSTATSDYYRNADGTFSRKVSVLPLNYRDSDGTWQPIDTTVARGADGNWHQKGNSLSVAFAAKASDTHLAAFGTGGRSVAYGLQGAAPVTGTASGSTVSYPGVLPDTDLQLLSTPIGLRESLILHSAEAGNSWVFPLDLKGLKPVLNKSGGVDLLDAAGKGVASIPAAYAFDSKIGKVSGERATTHAVTYQLTTAGGKPALRMTLDTGWLHDTARVFPVTVDPDTSVWDYVYSTYTESGYAAADHSQEQTIKVGSYDSGTHAADSFVQEWRTSFDGSGVSLISANLHLYDIWASTCTPEPFSVAQVTQPWKPGDVLSYPGPSYGSSIGSVTPTVSNACANTSGSQTGGDWVDVPLSTSAVQNWANGTTPDYGLAIYAPTTDSLHWKQFGSMAYPGDAPYIVYDYTGDIAPMVEATFPANNSAVETLTPELQAFADFQQNPTTEEYDFQVYDTSNTKVADSGLVTAGDWTMPAGKLAWNKTYYWTVQAYDGVKYSAAAPWSALTTAVPQPFITSTLSQNSDSSHGYDPSIGNYTTSDTDADIATAGPALQVVRNYNSRDFRTSGAFGSGWSSIFDAKATEQHDAGGNLTGVVVTYPDGSEVGYGRNADGSFSPPAGRFATLRAVTGGYTLTDKNDTVYGFTQAVGTGVYGITSVTDADGRALNLTWSSGEITAMTSAVSGRALHLTWSTPTGAGSPHITAVTSDPVSGTDQTTALTWTYSYSGDQLGSVCDPADATHCTQYGYTSGSQFQTQVLDAGASSLWQFNEAGGTTAASSAGLNEGSDNATYSNVTLGQTGPLAGSTATAAGFNGSSSYVELPHSLASSATQLTLSMWFKTTTAPGVLFSYSTLPLSYSMTQGQYTPGIYVGSDGKLNAEFWNSNQVSPIVSATAVNDGNWHQVVLAGAGDSQTLYLDGAKVGSLSGMISYSEGYHSSLQDHTYIGAGFLGGTWPDEPHYSSTSNDGYPVYFNGSIADVAFYQRGLTGGEVSSIYSAGTHASRLLTSITRPSGKTFAGIAYDTDSARVTQLTDDNGGVWKLAAPTVAGSSQVYRSAVLGAAPAGYWRLGDSAGATSAYDEVGYGNATYNSVTLGSTGPFSDTTAAKFDGSSSYLLLPSTDSVTTGPNSVEMWFEMPAGNTAGGVLFDEEKCAITNNPVNCGGYNPALYVGTDGKLHGKFWDSNGTSNGIVSSTAVNDGKWHHVLLAASTSSQAMYLDGQQVGTTSGTLSSTGQGYVYVGAGAAGGNWPNHPTNTLGYFPGSIADVAFYRTQLTAQDATAHVEAAKNSQGLLPVQTVKVTDPGNATLTYEYDPTNGNREIAYIDGLGHRTSYGYDTAGFQHTVTDPDGDVTVTGHDPRGNTVSVTSCQNQAANQCSTEYFTYYPDDTSAQLTTADPRNDLPLTHRDGRSASATDNTYLTSYGYDAQGNETSETTPPVAGFPNGRTTTTTYSDGSSNFPAADSGNVPAGLPVKTVSPGGAVTTVSYFHDGDIASTTDADGLVTKYTYDGIGRMTSQTVVSDTYPSGLTTSYVYDKDGQVTQENSPQFTDRVTGAQHTPVTSTVYDADGDVTSQTVSDSTGGDSPRTLSWTYNSYDQKASEEDANGNANAGNGGTTSYTYDAYGNKVSETDPSGTTIAYTYDANGDLLTQTLKQYTGDPVNPSTATDLVESSRAYDPAGRLASVTDAMGNTTSYTYTDDGLVATVTKTDSSGQHSFVLQSDQYDAAGNLTQRTTGNGATVTQYQVDAASRTTSTTVDPTGVDRVTQVSYTPDDLIASTTQRDSSGNDRVSTASYDPMGHVTSETLYGDASGHPSGWWKLNQSAGTTVTDSSGTGNTAAATDVTWNGDSAALNGTTSALSTNGAVLDTTGSYSVSAWVDLASAPTHNMTLVGQLGTENSPFYLQYNYAHTSSPLWSMNMTSNDSTSPAFTGAYSSSPAAAGAWTHLVGVYNASSGAVQLYVNGQLAGSATDTAPWAASGALTMGRAQYKGAAGDYLDGSLADVQVYPRALSAAEVGTLYNGGRTGGTVGSSNQQTTTWSYDKRGYPTSMTDANGNTTNYTYDEAGDLVVTSEPAVPVETGDGSSPVTAHPVTTRGYNTFGEVVEETDPNGNETLTAYDADGNRVSETAPSYTPPGSSTAITPTTTWAYDSAGDVTSRTLPDGEQTRYQYDQLGDVAQVTEPDGSKVHSTYDANGEELSVTDGTGAQTQATYDWLGRKLTDTTLERYPSAQTLTTNYSYAASATNPDGAFLASTSSPDGRTLSYGYDHVGEKTSVTDGAGNVTSLSYDYAGNLQKTTWPDGTSTEADHNSSDQPTYEKQFDAAGNLLTQTRSQYDGDGNLVSATDANGHTSTFTYDATGMVTQEIQPVSAGHSITTSFGYDASGNRTRYTDGRGNNWYTTYNSLGLQATAVEPATSTYTSAADSTTTYSYNGDGQVTGITQPGGAGIAMSYDSMGDLTQQSGSGADAATATRHFSYDANGRVLTAATDAAGTAGTAGYQPATNESFSYDDRGNLLSASGSAGSSSFAYSGDGLMTSRTDASGTTSYSWDNAGRLATVDDAATGTHLTYSYNALSQVSSIQYGSSGQTRSLSYDSLHRLTGDTLKQGAATVASISYGYDNNGNLTSKNTTGVAGASANTYSYDWANRLTSWNNGTTTTAYSYDDSGNRTQVGSNVYTYDARDQLTSDGVKSYTYTARGTLVQESGTGSSATYTYDAYGDQISAGSETYGLDATGRVITATQQGGGSRTLEYSGPGNEVAGDGTYQYSYDPSGGLLGINTYGATSTSTGRLALTDQHDDVVGTFTSGATALAGSATYDPLGNVTASSNPFGQLGYQSGWTDSADGKVNMAARWYNPATGQFMSKDTLSVSPVPNSASANPFAYVGDNPLDGTDPSGHCGGFFGCLMAVAHAVTHPMQTIRRAARVVSNIGHRVLAVARRIPIVRSVISHVHRAVSYVSSYVSDHFRRWRYYGHRLLGYAHRAWDYGRRVWGSVKKRWNAGIHKLGTLYNRAKNIGKKLLSTAGKALHTLAKAGRNAVKSGLKWVKNHAASIASMAVSAVVFSGCEVALGAATEGVGAIAGAGICGAAAGAAGGIFDQTTKCVDGKSGACSVGAYAKSILVGAVGGAVGGAVTAGIGGAIARSALGKMLPKLVTNTVVGAASGGLSGGAASATAYGTSCAGSSEGCSWSGLGDAAASGAVSGAESGGVSGALSGGGSREEEGAGSGGSCTLHSFTGSTGVLMADGTTKPIDQIKAGDKIANSVPGEHGTQSHTVTRVIVTHTDHDFVNVTIAPVTPGAATASLRSRVVSKAKLGLAAAAAGLALLGGAHVAATSHGTQATALAADATPVKAATSAAGATSGRAATFAESATSAKAATSAGAAASAGAPTPANRAASAKGATLTTTFHHPFYDETQAAFTEAEDLHVGDLLQTPTGAAEVTAVRLYHADTTTYDLTIGALHTYYVEAGDTPVLVHNNDGAEAESCPLPRFSVNSNGVVSDAERPMPTQRYNRKSHYGGAQTDSPAGVAARAAGEGQPCPVCGETMVTGTKTAPIPEHEPPLSLHYYLEGGWQMTQEERIAAAQEGIDGANCRTCQRVQGGQVVKIVKAINKNLGI